MKARIALSGFLLIATPAWAQTQILPLGSSGVMIQPQGGPATTFMPAPNLAPQMGGTLMQPPGGQPSALSAIGQGQLIQPPSGAPLNTAPTMVKPFGSSGAVIQTPGEPPIVCSKIGNAINCN